MLYPLHRWKRLFALAVCVAAVAAATVQAERPTEAPQASFAQMIAGLSGPAGEFDTDNLISNEKSYLQVIPQLEQRGISGGVYIGVGPDQNFSYIARIRPRIAFIVDIRRDNLLLHLLFKALFAVSRNRAEYLSLLTGRQAPDHVEGWKDAGIDRIIAYIDGARPSGTPSLDHQLHEVIRSFGVPLSSNELATIDRFHAAFVASGLSIRFHSFGRPPQSYDPSYRELLLETDRRGRRLNYLASEDDFQFVRSLEARDRIIPVVGDLGGTHALAAIGRWMAGHNQRLSAFYVSNVENYLFRAGTFNQFMQNLKFLPHTRRSVVVRSIFGWYARPQAAPGYYSASTVQDMDDLLSNFSRGRYQSYSDLVQR